MDASNSERPHDDEVELIDIIRILLKRRKMLGILVFGMVALAFFIVQLKYPTMKVATCQIDLSFPGINTHNNPDGTLFDKLDIVLPEVRVHSYENILKKYGSANAMDIHDIVNDMEIIEVIPEDIQYQIKKAQKKDADFKYLTSMYKIKAKTYKRRRISDELMKDILLEVVANYKQYFETRYGLEPLVKIEFPDGFIKNNEYYDILNVFQVYSNKLGAFLDNKITAAGFYKSKKSGYSFVDIKNEVGLLKDVYIKPLQAIVQYTQLTRETDALVSMKENKIKELTATKQKNALAADVSKKLLDKMNKDSKEAPSTTIMTSTQGTASEGKGVPGVNLDNDLYGEMKKNDYKSYLLKTIINSETGAINSSVDIEVLRKDIDDIKKNKKVGNLENFEGKLESIKEHLKQYSRIADELNAEYLGERIKNTITITRSPEVRYVRAISIIPIFVIVLFGSAIFSVFIVFMWEYISNNKQSFMLDSNDGIIPSDTNGISDQSDSKSNMQSFKIDGGE